MLFGYLLCYLDSLCEKKKKNLIWRRRKTELIDESVEEYLQVYI